MIYDYYKVIDPFEYANRLNGTLIVLKDYENRIIAMFAVHYARKLFCPTEQFFSLRTSVIASIDICICLANVKRINNFIIGSRLHV